jgi:hypothetical protein
MVWEQYVYTVRATSGLTTVTLDSAVNSAERWAIEGLVLTPLELTTSESTAPDPLTPSVPESADSSVLAMAALSLVTVGVFQKRLKRPA